LEVDAHLEDGLVAAEQWIDSFLENPTPDTRARLLAVLEKLDDYLERADYFASRSSTLSGSFAVVTTHAIGATGANAPCEEVPATEFQAQADLIKAAQRAVTEPGPDSLGVLKDARDALTAVTSQFQAGPIPHRE
jgi:hypothetical protein